MIIREIRKEDFADYIRVYRNAYPGVEINPEQMTESLEKRMISQTSKIYVAFAGDGRLVGGYTLYDFTIYQNYNELTMGGIGSVCVSLDSKKQGVAKALIKDSLKRMKGKGICTSILYPFRHDFYQKMGWGQVGEVKEYVFHPDYLPEDERRKYVRRAFESDIDQVSSCYEKSARSGNCMVKRSQPLWQFKLKNSNFFVFEKAGEIQGYMQVAFEKGNSFLENSLKVEELVCNTQDAYFGLLGFIASQLDQFSEVIYFTTKNDPFHILLKEPRRKTDLIYHLYQYSQRVGIGWMFRIVNVKQALLSRMNYHGTNLQITFEIQDSFLPENNGTYTLVLKDGKPKITQDTDRKNVITVDISTFAQLFTNYLTFSETLHLEKIKVNDGFNLEIIQSLDKAFELPEPKMLEFF